MILSPITSRWAQWSYDSMSDDGVGTRNEPLAHAGIQIANMVAHTAFPLWLTTTSNPHIMSYAYKGLDPAKFGMKAAMASRKEFQLASSAAFRMGSTIGGHLFWPSNQPIIFGSSKKGKAALAAISRGRHLGGRIGARLIPGLGWAMLAYDAYELVAHRRIWGVNL